MKYIIIILIFSFKLLATYEYKGNFSLYETFDKQSDLFFTGEIGKGEAYVKDGKYIIDNLNNFFAFETYSNFNFSKEKVFASTFDISFLDGDERAYYGVYIETTEGKDYFYINSNKKIYSKFENNNGKISNHRVNLSKYISNNEVTITILIDKGFIVYLVNNFEVCKTRISEEEICIGFGFSVEANLKVAINNIRFEEILY